MHFAQAEVLYGNWPLSLSGASPGEVLGTKRGLVPLFASWLSEKGKPEAPLQFSGKNVSVKLKSATINDTDSDLVLC